MDKIYKLLRNNQQTGPYALEELVQLGLKPFDLIWADGITAGWMYPSEIEAIKPYLGEEKKEPVDAGEAGCSAAHAAPLLHPEQATAPAAGAGMPITVPSPAQHIFLRMPAGVGAAKTAAVPKVPEPVAEEETAEQKLERKALELRQRVQALAEAKKAEEGEPALDTKYSRSLEDIKEEYAHWMHEQRHKGSGLQLSKRQWLVAALVLVLAGAGYTTLQWLRTPSTRHTDIASAQKVAALPVKPPVQATQAQEPVTQSVVNTDLSERHGQMINDLEWANRKIEKDLEQLAEKRKSTASAPKTKSSARVVRKPSTSHNGNREVVTYEPPKTESFTPANTEVRTVAYSPEKKAVPLSQQIEVKAKYLWTSRGKGFSGLELALRNNSVQVLKTVAIDVFYYRDSRLLDKKTVYFNNIQPGESFTLTAPGNKRASSATYQLGLISSEGGLYVARQ